MAPTGTDEGTLTWVAGLFEGEGTITISSGGKRGYTVLIASLTMTDKEPPMLLHEVWGGGIRAYEPGGRARTAWTWRCSSRTAARFIREIRPHLMTQRVQAKADLALAYHAERRQGSRSPDYKATRWAFKDRMAVLNRRGT